MRLLLAITLLACSSPAFAHRTLADDPDIPDDASVVFWEAVDVEVSQRGLDPARHGAVVAQLETAMAIWRAPACSALILRGGGATSQPARPGDGRNTIQWVDDWASRGFSAHAAATTDVQLATVGGEWRIVEGDIYLNAGVVWDVFSTEADAVSLSAVLTHELGHLIGLEHPCEEGSCSPEQLLSVLAPIYESSRGLSVDDIEGLCSLYPACDESCGSGHVCSRGNCVATECMRGECPGELVFGSDCTADSECASAFCAEGRCTTECTASSECGESSECGADLWCRDPRASRDACNSGEECTTGLCLLDAPESGTCTNACASDDECLVGESCVDTDGESVCRFVASSGCSANGSKNGSTMAWLLFALVLGALRRSGWGDDR